MVKSLFIRGSTDYLEIVLRSILRYINFFYDVTGNQGGNEKEKER